MGPAASGQTHWRKRQGIALALLVTIGTGLWWFGAQRDNAPALALGAPLPAFTLKPIEGLAGSGFDAGALQGQVTLLNAFASWCVPCRAEHPLLVELAAGEGVVLAGMNVTDLPENATDFLAELGNPYALAGADTDKSVANRLGMVGLPHSFVIDPQGRLLLSHPGPISRKFVDEQLPRLLARAGVP
ncbi:redoxin family protein [Devosia sp. 1635]|uniref:redoxin family protein n=1 Tax=Devosia sp. 1635 TaxID=2726066 RepID=UPI00156493AA|nr:redoxin family protein [Devosia sp. 1635]